MRSSGEAFKSAARPLPESGSPQNFAGEADSEDEQNTSGGHESGYQCRRFLVWKGAKERGCKISR
jgi:hypothetical protein